MILTGKAKEDFKEFLYNKYDVLYELKDYHKTMLYAEIIEWFDSVGIQIEINICSWNKGYEFSPTVYTNFIYIGNMSATCCIDRKTATKQAIKKANEIYNTK